MFARKLYEAGPEVLYRSATADATFSPAEERLRFGRDGDFEGVFHNRLVVGTWAADGDGPVRTELADGSKARTYGYALDGGTLTLTPGGTTAAATPNPSATAHGSGVVRT